MMKSARLQLLITLAAVLTAAVLFADKGLPPDESIHYAVKRGDLEAVRRSLKWGVDPSERGPVAWGLYGWSPLHLVYDDAAMARLLIAHGANVNARDAENATPLHWLACGDRNEVAELLIAHGADVNARQEQGMTPLHFAALWGRKAMAELLVSHGANVNAQEGQGQTPLHVALMSPQLRPGHKDVAEFLVAHGADVNGMDNYGRTPLRLMLEGGDEGLAEIVRQHEAKK